MMEYTGKNLTVKDWFGRKKMAECGFDSCWCFQIWAVLKETEKAVYAMVNFGIGKVRTFWIPKSVLVDQEIPEGINPMSLMTFKTESYEEAKKTLTDEWSLYE